MSSTTDPALRVARVVPVTEAEGPGRRTALWVQGCTIRCPGCFNPHLWAAAGGDARSVDELLGVVLAADVEGITLLGGEPFDQAGGLAPLAAAVQGAGLSVMTFTGHVLEELRAPAASGDTAGGDTAVGALLEHTDLLVDGPFLADHVDHRRPWVGSTNQRFHALTDRYADVVERLDGASDRLEVVVAASGEVRVNGWADADALETLLAGLGTRADRLSGLGGLDRGRGATG